MHYIERARQMREEGISSSVCLICWLAKAVFILIQKLIVLGWKDSHSGSLISSFGQWQPWVPGPALQQAPVAGWTRGERGQGLEMVRQMRAGLRLPLPDGGPQGTHKYASKRKDQRQIQTWQGFCGLLTVWLLRLMQGTSWSCSPNISCCWLRDQQKDSHGYGPLPFLKFRWGWPPLLWFLGCASDPVLVNQHIPNFDHSDWSEESLETKLVKWGLVLGIWKIEKPATRGTGLGGWRDTSWRETLDVSILAWESPDEFRQVKIPTYRHKLIVCWTLYLILLVSQNNPDGHRYPHFKDWTPISTW